MNKKRIIAYSLAIASLFGIYKEGKELGKFIRENYLDDNNENITEYTTETTNPTIVLPDNTIAETIIEETIPETTPTEETIPATTENIYNNVTIPAYAICDLPLYDENGNVICNIEHYEKVIINDITNYNNRFVKCNYNEFIGYIDFTSLEILPETYAEVDISDQKVYCYYQGELVLTADCVTGIPTYGTTKGTNKGYTKINGKLYDAKLMGGAPSKIFISFNPDAEGFHDACWRSQFGGDIYLTNGSHGCVNMRLEDVQVLDKYLNAGDHVLVHK